MNVRLIAPLLSILLGLSLDGQEHGRFKLIVVRGEGDQHNVKKGRSTSQAVVEVRDENDRPVAGVLLTFALPAQGAGGSFVGGTQVTSLATDATGRASVTFTPNKAAGQYVVRVNGSVQGQPVSALIAQSNLALGGGLSSGAIVALIAAAAGAALGVAIGLDSSKPATGPAPVTAPALRVGINPGGITIGTPRP